jgi:hypothetical protein
MGIFPYKGKFPRQNRKSNPDLMVSNQATRLVASKNIAVVNLAAKNNPIKSSHCDVVGGREALHS